MARCLLERFPTEWKILSCTSQHSDITQSVQLMAQVNICQPDLIINCAAYTAVDNVESETAKAAA